METIHVIDGYPTSTDYTKLYDLAQEQSIICLAPYRGFEGCIDVARTIVTLPFLSISARGISYVHADNKDDFIEQCVKAKVRFIIPTEQQKSR